MVNQKKELDERTFKQVLSLIKRGLKQREIAAVLRVSLPTANKYVQAVKNGKAPPRIDYPQKRVVVTKEQREKSEGELLADLFRGSAVEMMRRIPTMQDADLAELLKWLVEVASKNEVPK